MASAERHSRGVPEVHELPDRVLGDRLIDDLAALVVLDADLARKPQVGAIEADELRGGALDPVQGVDHPVARKIPVPGEGHHVALVVRAVRVSGGVCNWLPGDGIGKRSERFERQARRVVTDEEAVLREHEHGNGGVVVLLGGRDVAQVPLTVEVRRLVVSAASRYGDQDITAVARPYREVAPSPRAAARATPSIDVASAH